jgi:DNA-binding winged helix-turn-helix (wHTH) protein
MIHRFQGFEIDETQRELRVADRVMPLQPRPFELLVYLARHCDRVVPKDELLDVLWKDVIVADNSLQRAVSLIRSALAPVAAADAIRTFPRHGYRLCAERLEESCPAVGDDLESLSPKDLHRWAYERHFEGESQDALDSLERLVTARRARGEMKAAAWAGVVVGLLRLERNELVLAQGWQRHAARLLESSEAGLEMGYADFLGSRLAMLLGDNERALEMGEACRKTGVKIGDAGLEGLGLLAVAEAKLFLGRTREGLEALDEAGAAVVAGGLETWAQGLVYCGVIFCCMSRADWNRAGQWTEQFSRWGADKGSLAYPGLCRLHRVEVLTAQGALMAAEQELDGVQESLPKLSPWTEGEVWRVAGDLRAALGDFDKARHAYEQALAAGWDTQFEMAVLRLHEGDAIGAAETLGKLIAGEAWSCQSKLGRALTSWSIAASQAGDVEAARIGLDRLDGDPDLVSTPALQAMQVIARAELAVAEDRAPEGLALMRRAISAFSEIGAVLEVAHGRCRLANLLETQGEGELARVELAAAHQALLRAGAGLAAERCLARFGMNPQV